MVENGDLWKGMSEEEFRECAREFNMEAMEGGVGEEEVEAAAMKEEGGEEEEVKKQEKGTLGIAKELKEKGNAAFKDRLWKNAQACYSQAITTLQEARGADGVRVWASSETPSLLHALHLNLSACLLKLRDFSEAITAASMARDWLPSSSKAYFRMGCGYVELGRYSDAVDVLKEAARLAPDSKAVRAKLCVAQDRIATYG